MTVRRTLLLAGAALAAPMLAGCNLILRTRNAIPPGQPVSPPDEEALVALVARRVAVAGCSDNVDPGFRVLALRDPGTTRNLYFNLPSEGDWEPDPSHPLLIRRPFLLHFPAGPQVIASVVHTGPGPLTSMSLPPLAFAAVPGQVTYVGGIGWRTQFARNRFGCGGDVRDHGVFFHADPDADLPVFQRRWPDLANRKIEVRLAVAPGWPAAPRADAAAG